VTVHPFDDEDEALAMANGVQYGLAASVWTQDLTRAHRFSEALEAGMVWVNTWLHRDLRVPFGGVKDSGVGREGGRYSLEFFSESSNICIQLGRPRGFVPDVPKKRPPQDSAVSEDGSQTASFADAAAPSGPPAEEPTTTSPPAAKKKLDTDVELAAVAGRTIAYTEGVDESMLASLSADPSETVDYVQVASSLTIDKPQHTLDRDEAPDVVHLGSSHQHAAYPQARRVGELLFLSGVGPHNPKTNAIVGGATHDSHGNPLDYHFSGQALAVLENVRAILKAAGSSLENVIDITVFLVNMERDLETFEKVFSDYFSKIQATRTIIAVKALSSPIAIECKVVAHG